MNEEPRFETVGDCLQRVVLPNGGKLQTRDYQVAGRYPVIDQGQNLIAGWTDTVEGVIEEQLPVVVFGDHSRTFKYVDFPFVRGADGTQILKPRPDVDPRYFYYACRSIDLSSRGYNRHFALLKEQVIPVPDHAEQLCIGRALQQVDRYIQMQQEQLAANRSLKRAALRDLFAQGLGHNKFRVHSLGEFPDDWAEVAIGDLGRVVTGTTPPTKELANYVGGTIPFIAPGDFGHGERVSETEKALTPQGLAVSRVIPAGATCFVCIGSTIGKVGVSTAPASATNQQINTVIASDNYEPRYVFHLLTRWADHIRRHASPSPVPILSKGPFEKITIVAATDMTEQRQISDILDAIDERTSLLTQKLELGERLMAVLLHRLFTGAVRIADLGLDHLSTGDGDAA